ncbi:MAG: MoxR family ATPase [Planctomycetes bacterium]|nr:MoxR family ATPase [Planctomycetota bacterium]
MTEATARAAEPTAEVLPAAEVAAIRQHLARLIANVEGVLHGKREAVELAVIALLAGGHVLIEDVPGVGKTLLARALARSIDGSFRRLQFTPDLLPSDVLGTSIYEADERRFVFHPGPIFAHVVLADEINRTSPRAQSALLEAMNEAQVSIDGETHALPQPFLVLATQNPIEYAGTYPLPEAQLDRFLLRLSIGYPDRVAEKRMLELRRGGDPHEDLRPVCHAADIARWQARVPEVAVTEALVDYLLDLVAATRGDARFALGVSPRGTLALYRAAQARALLDGRAYCVPDDLKALVGPCWTHRVLPQGVEPGEEAERLAGQLLREILARVEVPL